MSIKSRLVHLERRRSDLLPSESQMTDDEMLVEFRHVFELGRLRFTGKRVVTTIAPTAGRDYELCNQLAEILTTSGHLRPDGPLVLLLPAEAKELLELLDAGQLVVQDVPAPDGTVQPHRLCTASDCHRRIAHRLLQYADLALEAIHGWVRALVGEVEDAAP